MIVFMICYMIYPVIIIVLYECSKILKLYTTSPEPDVSEFILLKYDVTNEPKSLVSFAFELQ